MTLEIRDDFGSIVALVDNREVDICSLLPLKYVYNSNDEAIAEMGNAEAWMFDLDFDRSKLPTDTYIEVEVEDISLENPGYPFGNLEDYCVRYGWFVISLADSSEEVA